MAPQNPGSSIFAPRRGGSKDFQQKCNFTRCGTTARPPYHPPPVSFEGGKKWLGNCLGSPPAASKDFFLGPGGLRSRFWEALAPTLRPRGSRTPQNPLRGAILDDLLMIVEGFSHAFLHYLFACFFGRLCEGCSFNFLVFSMRAKRRPRL